MEKTKESIRELVCRNFNRLIEDSGMTKRAVAQGIKVSETTLQRWGNGQSSPELGNIDTLAKFLGVDPIEFYRSEEEVRAKVLPLSQFAKRLTAIPDDIFEKAQAFGPESEIWDEVREAFNDGHKRRAAEKSKKNHA